jgi:SPOR domain
MGHTARILAALAILAAGALPLAAFDGPTQTTASKKKAGATDKPADAAADEKNGAEDDKQKAAEIAKRTLEAAIKAYESGKSDEAIKGLDAALHAGLTGQQTARALYYRGLANRKLGKPGLAISDLTSALWLKDGLVGADREAALKNRAAAYQEAGISTVPDVPQSSNSVDASATNPTGWQTAMSASPSAPAASVAPAAPNAPAKTHSNPGYLSAFSSDAPSGPASDAPAEGPAHAPGSSLAAMSTGQGAPEPAPAAPTSTGGIGGFFSSIGSIFGGGTSSPTNANDGAVTTSSITPAPPQPAPAPATAATSWSDTTQVTTAAPGPDIGSAFVTKVSTSDKAPRAEKVAAREPAGKFRLQVAAVRSRSEADALAAKLVANHGNELGARQPEISEAVLGSMGTFYRVRVGPYADAKEPQQLCGGLRSSGFDCLVVTQ